MHMKLLSVAALFAACVAVPALAAPADNTAKGYTPTTGPVYSVPSTVILQGNPDGLYGAVPINTTHPLPVTVTGGGGGTVQIDQTTPGTTNGVVVNSSALPTGAATSANQSTANTSLSSIDGKTPAKGSAISANSSPVVIASDQAAVPVSAASLPLPSGAATAANQATANTSLSSIDGKVPAKGAATTANSSPVNIASDQVVPVNDPGLPDTLGQKTMANSTSVALASDQSAVTVAQSTAANLNATVVGTGTFATQAAPTASTIGGATPYTAIVPNNTTGVLVGTAGQHTVYAITAFNNSATIAYVKFYDTVTAPTCGSGTVVYHGLIPANTSGAGFVNPVPVGVAFGSGIGYCITTGIADNDTTAPAASTYLINIEYK